MNADKKTLINFMKEKYKIPLYQRAYAWEENQLKTFLNDLKEIKENNYFFGNVLVQKNDSAFDIIDGQQRTTTILIFIRSLYDVLQNRKEKFDANIENKKFLDYLEEDFLIFRGEPKLEAVEYDRDYFKDFIIKGDKNKNNPTTPSAMRIKNAREFFEKELSKMDTKDIIKILDIIKKSEILVVKFEKVKDSVLMFELQNNRGKSLTNLEKLKSYLSYQIYTYCSEEEAENKLKEICKIFEEIYRILNDIEILDENRILNYFNVSKFGFGYRENDDSLNYKKEFKKEENKNRLKWIDNYLKDLLNAFRDFKNFSTLKEGELAKYKELLLNLNLAIIYPFIIKSYSLFRENEEELLKIFKALEILTFRIQLVRSRADIRTRLDTLLKNFKNSSDIFSEFKNICEKEHYWSDENIEFSLKNIADNKTIVHYIFAAYEEFLKNDSAKTKGYALLITNPEVEHISPQKENGEKLKNGYTKYDEDFYKNYLNTIGNLLSIDKSHNASIGNIKFEEKLQTYKNTGLLHHKEIEKYMKDNKKWDKEAIKKRDEELKKFILETWRF